MILEERIGALLLIGLLVMVVLQIGGRVLKSAPVWTEELSRFLFIWVVCVGISAGVYRRSHVGTEFLVARLSTKWRRVFKVVSNVLFILFNSLVIVKSIGLFEMQFKMGHCSPALGLPLWAVTLALLAGFFLATVRLFATTLRLIVKGTASEKS